MQRPVSQRQHTVPRSGAALTAYRVGDHGPRVFLIQGTGVAGEGWRPQIDALAQDHQVAWFDARGLGSSTWDGRAFTAETLVEDTHAVFASLNWPNATVVGHSLGGLLAMQFMLDHPQKVTSLGLWSTFPHGRALLAMNMAKLTTSIRMSIGTTRSRQRAAVELVYPHAFLADRDVDAIFVEMAQLFRRPPHIQSPIVWAQLRAIRALDPSQHSSRVTCPIRVFTGALDVVAPVSNSRLLADRLKAPLTVVDEAGHALPLQCPELAEQELRKLTAAGARPTA